MLITAVLDIRVCTNKHFRVFSYRHCAVWIAKSAEKHFWAAFEQKGYLAALQPFILKRNATMALQK